LLRWQSVLRADQIERKTTISGFVFLTGPGLKPDLNVHFLIASKFKRRTPVNSTDTTIRDDESTYGLQYAPCPSCGMSMPAEARDCTRCGYDLRTANVAALSTMPRPDQQTPAPRQPGRAARGVGGGRFRVALVLLVMGGGLLVAGFKEVTLLNASSRNPETISLAKLADRGPQGNPNIILTDFRLCNNFVQQTRTHWGQKEERWDSVWVPIVPRDEGLRRLFGAGAAGRNVQAIIFSKHVGSKAELAKLAVPQLRGMVINAIASLGADQLKLLQQAYPGIDFERCMIIEDGHEPASAALLSLYLGVGGLLALLGVLVLAKPFLSR
jgi:hypothetical protein